MLEIIHLDRTKVYIANVVKCRPPQNRDPLNVEQDACIGYLRRQAALMKPKIIVCLGRIAAKAIIKEDFKITQEHGQWFQRGGVQMTAIYHPAALLRDEQKRPETFLDLKVFRPRFGSCASILNVKKCGNTFPHLFHFRFQFSGCGDYVPVQHKVFHAGIQGGDGDHCHAHGIEPAGDRQEHEHNAHHGAGRLHLAGPTGGDNRPLSLAIIRRPLTANSRTRTISSAQAGIWPISTNQSSAAVTSILSARGSANLPKSVTKLYFLAIFPSSRSVKLATMKWPPPPR